MYIKTLHIYGYGKMIDTTFDLEKGLHVFFGENEAGKSTIQSFIHSVLFGFPTKSQADNRFEPRHGLKYGGKITLMTDSHGTVTIERLSGKAIGDVTVYFENGTIGHEQALNEILQGLDKHIFTSIFSFGLKGLQEINSIKSEDLNHYLFSSSILGNDQVVELERKISKDMDNLFKPGGKKPEINQELEDMTILEEKIRDAKGQITHYQTLIQEELRIENEITILKDEVQRLSDLHHNLNLFEQYFPLRIESNALKEQQSILGGYPSFPLDGTKRLELLQSGLVPIEARLKSVKNQLVDAIDRASNLEINENLLNAEEEIQSFVAHSRRIELSQGTLSSLSTKIETLTEEINSIKKSLGLKASDEELVNLELSLSQKEEIRNNLQVYNNVLHKKEILKQQQEQLKSKLDLTEETVQQYEKQFLPVEKKKELEQLLITRNNRKASSNEQKEIISKNNALTHQINELERREKAIRMFRNLFLIPLSVIVFILGLWNLVADHLSFAISMFALAPLLAIGGVLLVRNLGSLEYLSLLREEQQGHWNQLQQLKNLEYGFREHQLTSDADRLLAKEEQLEQLLQKEKLMLEQLEKQYDKTIEQFEQWEIGWHEISTKLLALKTKLHIPKEYSNESLYEVFEQMILLVSKIIDLDKKNQERKTIEQEILAYNGRFEELIRRLVNNVSLENITPVLLAQELEKEKDRNRERKILIQKQHELQDEIFSLEKEAFHFQEQISKLYDLAGVKEEEVYRERAALHTKWNELQVRMENIREKIQLLLKNNDELEQVLLSRWEEFKNLLQDKDSLSRRYKEYQGKEKDKWKELANITLEKKHIEEKGTYSTLVHQMELKKAELMHKAKRWAKLSLAKDLLSETKGYYQKVRMPSVVNKAEYYFSKLTEGEYGKLFPPIESGGFIVERKDGARFSPGELSQGTTEQLYLALRLALARSYKTSVTVPIIIDDSFVNFDGIRLQITLELLRELSRERQIVFFTCHKHILSCLEGERITYLSRERLSV